MNALDLNVKEWNKHYREGGGANFPTVCEWGQPAVAQCSEESKKKYMNSTSHNFKKRKGKKKKTQNNLQSRKMTNCEKIFAIPVTKGHFP